MKKYFNKLLQKIACLLGAHELESNGISESTFNEVNSWCKHCNKPL